MTRRTKVTLAATLAAGLGAGGLMAEIASTDPLAAWRAEGGKASSLEIDRRGQLAAATAAVTPGLSGEEVRERLGAPNADDGSAWVYVVAPQPVMTSELDLLVVRFDPEGRVLRTEAMTSETYAVP